MTIRKSRSDLRKRLTFCIILGMAQRGIQGELTGHLSVAFVLTLLTFCYQKGYYHLNRMPQYKLTRLTCPPGPELLENVNSTRFLSTFTWDEENFATQSEASECSLSVVSWARRGGFGRADGGGAVWMNLFRWVTWIVVVLVNSLDVIEKSFER